MQSTQPARSSRRPRPSFRDKVRSRLKRAGIRGVSRDTLNMTFNDVPTVKVTVALNELLGRQEVYLRNGIYRLTHSP